MGLKMKIKCPHCNTNYNIDDSKIPEKGLLVKCSVCKNQYRIKKQEESAADDDVVGKMHEKMDIETGRYDHDQSNPSPEKSDRVNVNKDDFLEDEETKEDTLDFKIKTPPQEPEKTVPPVEKRKDDNEFSLSNDRFDGDSLFEDKPSDKLKKEDHLSLFDDDPDEEIAGEPVKTADSSDLFSDAKSPETKVERGPAEKSSKPGQDDFLKELFGDAKTGFEEEEEKKGIYFRKKSTGEVVGPFDEAEIENLMLNAVISEEDDISYDGFSWSSSDGSLQPKTESKSSPRYGLSLDDEEGEAFDSISFDQDRGISETGVFKDAANEFEDTSFTSVGGQNQNVDHIFIPDDFSEDKMEKTGHQKKSKKERKGDSPVLFYAVLSFSTMIVLGLIGGGFYYYLKYVKGTQGDILDNISESIAVNTGTLVDVRDALNKDLPDDYINSIGILKQYLKSEDSAPSAVGLDGQVKFNLLISYNRRLEPSATLNEKIDAALKKAPANLDLIKAKALSLYESKMFDEALVLIQPFAESSDQEIFYILGLIAQAKKDVQKAEMFFNQGFMQGGGKNSKIIYALAEMKYRNGDAQSAMAFLNRIISDNPNYLKAYLFKAGIIMNTDNKLEEAEKFLKGVSTMIISKAEDFQKADYYQKLATIAHKRGLMKEAVGYYEKAVEINKTDTSSIATIADFYVQISNSSKAMEYYEMALKIDPKFPPAILGKTEIFILLGQNDKVYLELAKLDIKSVVDAQFLIRLGRIYYKIGDKGKSMEFYDLAIKSNPSLVEPYLAKVVILLEFKKIKEIDAIAAVVEKLGKETYAFNLIKAVVQHEEANYKRAEEYFKKAVERNTAGDDRVFFYYGLFLFDQQNYRESSKMLEKAYKIDPRNYNYIQSYADSLEKEKKWKAVIDLLETGTFNEKKMYRSFVTLANAFYHLNKFDEALNFVNRAIELNNQHTHVFHMKAKIYYAMEKYNEAEKEIDTAVVIDMRNFDNYMLYAKVLAKKGDFKGAIEKIEAAEKIDPSDQQLMLMKGIIYKNLDDYRSALAYFRKVTNKSFIKEAYLEIGESYLQLNRVDDAMKYFKKAENSGNKLAHKHLARIYYESGKLDQAVTYYRKALRADKNDTTAMRQLGYIYKEKQEWSKALSYLKMYQKRINDAAEKKMIDEEVYFLEKNLPQGRPVHIAESLNELDENDSEAINERAKELYIEGRALRDEDPETARDRFREVMKIVPKTNEYYKKAFKAFNKLNEVKEE